MMTFLHLMEMADGVEVLLSSSSVHPAKLLLRSMLEATLTIEYILKADTRRRSFAWLVARAHRKLSLYELVSQDTVGGRQFRSETAGHKVAFNVDAVPSEELQVATDNLRRMLKQKNYAEAEAEYRRLRSKRKRDPEWFSYYGGPPNIRELARQLGWLSVYQFLYRAWSELTHAGDGGRWLTKTASGQPAFFVLRTPTEMLQLSNLAISLLLDSIQTMLRHYSRNYSLKRWYLSEVRPSYMALTTTELRVNEREVVP